MMIDVLGYFMKAYGVEERLVWSLERLYIQTETLQSPCSNFASTTEMTCRKEMEGKSSLQACLFFLCFYAVCFNFRFLRLLT